MNQEGDFNSPGVCWKYNTADMKHCGRFMESVEGNLLTQLVREPAKEGTPLALLLVHRERLLSDVMVGGCYGHKMAVFNSQRTKEVGQQNCYLQLLEGTLVSLGDCLRESLGV